MDWELEYYQRENERIPVLEFLKSLEPKIRVKMFLEIELLEIHGTALREPYVKPIKGNKCKGLYELRVKFSSNIVRVFYFLYLGKKIVLLSGFMKKSEKTPKTERERALSYKTDYERRCEE